MRKNPPFLLALCATFFLSYISSGIGSALYDLKSISTICIMLMYVSLGLSVDTSHLRRGLSQWPLHVAVQGSLFIIAPILSFLVFLFSSALSGRDLSIGLIFIGCVPTTITSCIMLTKRFGGNVIASLYNSVLSQCIGVFVTPLLISAFLATQFESVSSFSDVFLSLLQKVIIPFVLGALLKRFHLPVKRAPEYISFYGIFCILYMHLAKVISSGMLQDNSSLVWIPLVASLCLCVIQVLVTWVLGGVLSFSKEDRICLVFTGSQKTLGMGVPLAAIYFSTQLQLAMYVTLIIIMYYVSAMVLSVLLVQNLISLGDRKV